MNAKSGIPGFHSVRLHRATGSRGKNGDRETLVHEVRTLTPPTDAQTSQSSGNFPADLSIETIVSGRTLIRNCRIRVIGKQTAIELTIWSKRVRPRVEIHQTDDFQFRTRQFAHCLART